MTPSTRSGGAVATEARARPAPLLVLALLVVLALVAHAPALAGGFVWDDDDHVVENEPLRDLAGLRRIWLEPGATTQYYPLVHSSFWLEYHAWGLRPAGYHVVNVLLHALTAFLLGRVLLRLNVGGAWLAAAIFAVHPVHVESVAWITERKNVLSGALYMAAALAWLRYARIEEPDAPRRPRDLILAFVLLLGALLSKTVTCTLPAALLLVGWWKQGRVARRDVLALSPFVVVGAALGLATAWIEKFAAGAQGADWSLTVAERLLIAGRAPWFYAAKLAWPVRLTFIYPRWSLDAGAAWQWLFPAALVGVIVGLWLARGRLGRGPLVAVLFFIGTLAPALGFFDFYPMRFSFVADHFQYLASAGLIALAAACLARLPRAAQVALVLVLAALTFRQARIYRSVETLWEDTLRKNPAAWIAHNNLGLALAGRGRLEEAAAHFRQALALRPGYAEAHYNLGLALAAQGRWKDAIDEYERALAIEPGDLEVMNNLAWALATSPDDSVRDGTRALALAQQVDGISQGASAAYLDTLAAAQAETGRWEEAIASAMRALDVATASGDHETAGQLEQRLSRYRAHEPYREPAIPR